MITNYDKREQFDNNIKPILNDMIARCSDLDLPVFVSFAISNDNEKTTYYNDMISSNSAGVILTDNKLADFVNILNGFFTVPEKKILEMEYDTSPDEKEEV